MPRRVIKNSNIYHFIYYINIDSRFETRLIYISGVSKTESNLPSISKLLHLSLVFVSSTLVYTSMHFIFTTTSIEGRFKFQFPMFVIHGAHHSQAHFLKIFSGLHNLNIVGRDFNTLVYFENYLGLFSLIVRF